MSDSTTNLATLTAQTANNETRVNELVDALSPASVYGRDASTTTGLTWGYYGGRYGGTSVANGTVALTGSATNYVVALRSTGAVSVSTTTTNWLNTPAYARLYSIVAGSATVTSYQDHRAGPYGSGEARPRERAINSQSAAYAIVAGDADTTILHPAADTTARTFTIPANGSVPYPTGTVLKIVNQNAAGVVTIAITTDTMRLAGAGTTGSRSLAANGVAYATKITSTEWIIEGTGLT